MARYEVVDPAAERQMAAARSSLNIDAPWWGTLAMSMLTTVQDPSCETAWTDGRYLGYNPEFTKGMTHLERVGLIAHEVEHVAKKHHIRMGERDAGVWNEACDSNINPGLKRAGFHLPDGCLMGEPGDEDRTTEAIYARLMNRPRGGGGGGGGQGGGQGGQKQGPGKPGDKPGHSPGGWGEVRKPKNDDGTDLSPTELGELEREINVQIYQATQVAKKAGKLPAGIERLLEDLQPAKADWREILRRWASEVGKNDSRWNPPNRRFVGQGLYLPSLHSEEIGEGWLVMDTSGSVFGQLHEFASEIQGMLEQFGSNLNILYCDTEVHGPDVIEPTDLPLELHPKGGGGTDFRPPFEWLAEQGITPKWLVYFTDMCGTFPVEDPGFPVMWAKWGNWGGPEVPFGELIEVDDLGD